MIASLPLSASFSDAERLRLALDAASLGDWSWDAASDVVTLFAARRGNLRHCCRVRS